MKDGKYLVYSDKKLQLDLRRSKGYTNKLENVSRDDSDLTLTVKLKAAVNKTLSLSVTGYSQEEYLHSLFDKGVFMMYKHYTISKQKDITA